MATFEGYYDPDATEREKLLAIQHIGPKTAEKLIERYDTAQHAADRFLGSRNWHIPEIGKERMDDLRDAFQRAGYAPPCACDDYRDVKNSQARDDVLSHCRTCGETIVEYRPDVGVRLDLARPRSPENLRSF